SENMRVLKWIFERVQDRASGREHALGTSPAYEDLDWHGLESYPAQDFTRINRLDQVAWRGELLTHREFLSKFGERLPAKLMAYHEGLQGRLNQ
ncbi:MAG TPA: phosphoenolpyruvate carboxykinase domain-containing protein, partial [Bdellovibrionales bacterium]|nr:phosphoenolpyruvate carboxykinase domain-containing protein [Bdellovibrionales bacterium]